MHEPAKGRGGDEIYVSKWPCLATLCAHGAEIDGPVSPAAQMIVGRRWVAADFASSPRALVDLFEGARWGKSQSIGIAPACQVPELLPQCKLTLGVGDHPTGKRTSELTNEGSSLLTGSRTVRATAVAAGLVTVRTSSGVNGKRFRLGSIAIQHVSQREPGLHRGISTAKSSIQILA